MTWLAPGGGADIEVYLSILALYKDYDFHLVVGRQIHQNDFATIPGLKIHICPDLDREINVWMDLKSIYYHYKLMRREKYDIVYTHETKSSLVARVAGWLARMPFIIYGIHGVVFNDPMSRLKRFMYVMLEKSTVWMSDLLIANSKDGLHNYRIRNIANHVPAKIIYGGIDTSKFLDGALTEAQRDEERAKIGVSKDDKLIINVGRFSVSKAQRFTIEAFAKIKKQVPNAKLLLVGEGALMDDCKKQAKDLGVADDVIFYGFTEQIAKMIYLADQMIMTSLREGLPRVVVEAALCKVPTVTFEVEGIHEILKNNETGFIVDQYDVDGIVDRSVRLLKDEELGRSFVEKNHKFAVERFDYKPIAEQIRAVFDAN